MGKRKIIAGEVIGIVIGAIVLVASACAFIFGISRCVHYNRVLQAPLYVDAEVTLHREDEDSEGDTIYVAYVSYTVGDTYYKNVRYDSEHKLANLPDVGTKLRLAVDPTNPKTLLKTVGGTGFMTAMYGMVLFSVLAGFLRSLRRKKLSRFNRWVAEDDVMVQDLHIVIRARFFRVLALLLTVMLVTLRLVFPRIFGTGYVIAAIVFGVFWLISVINAAVATYKVNNGMYEIHADKMTKKEESSDTDGGTSYTLYYESAGRSWSKNVTLQKYLAAEVGATVYAVYLKGSRTPILHYDQQGDATSYI